MTRGEIDAYIGRRAKVLRADGVIHIGRIEKDSVARIRIVGKRFGHSIQYQHILQIQAVSDSVPDTD